MSVKILVVDDEPPIVELTSAYLLKEGFQVSAAADGPTGLERARTIRPDVVVLDIMLPGMDGLEVLTRLRRESDAYVILLTAKSEETDKIVGLAVGADDYLTKPFSPRELVARIKAALRRLRSENGSSPPSILATRHVRIDMGRRQAWIDDRLLDLTPIEFDLLRTLVEYRGMVLSREQLLQHVWGYDFYGEERVVDVHIGHVRQKVGLPPLIATVRSVGYRFEDEPL